MTRFAISVLLAIFTLSGVAFGGGDEGIAMTYQGYLEFEGEPVDQPADITFTIFENATGGGLWESSTHLNVPVSDGLFTVEFGENFVTSLGYGARWIEIAVRVPAGEGSYTTLPTRQRLNAAPYALQVQGIEIIGIGPYDFTFNGDVTINGVIDGDLVVDGMATVDILRITGGSDIAEPFSFADEKNVTPGMLVAIDSEQIGQLRLATSAYDPTVAGIISGAGGVNTGLTLTQEGSVADGTHPVALTGRVWCWCDADANGPIKPGSMLTTSATPGHAMAATDRDRAFGATVGKAMSPLESGRGLVLVLVNLQ